MRPFLFALITATLGAQEPAREAKFQVAGSELRYLYAPGSGGPLLLILPGATDEPAGRRRGGGRFPGERVRGRVQCGAGGGGGQGRGGRGGGTSAGAVSRHGRLGDRQPGVRARLLDRDDEIRSEEAHRRLEIDAGD